MKTQSKFLPLLVSLAFSGTLYADSNEPQPKITGELKKWHKVTLTFTGPETSETAERNPFLHYRFNVDFKHAGSGKTYTVPGYFAADGNAAHSSATSGDQWRVHFSPDEIGEWSYTASFYDYDYVAVSEWKKPAKPAKTSHMHGASGTFSVAETDKTGRDFRGKGRLQVGDDRYLRFAGTGEIFFKCGPDAPENLLSYEDFDGTFQDDGIYNKGAFKGHPNEGVKSWKAHLQDWKAGDPTWGDGKGKALVGALNYLESKGMNAFSFLTLTIVGDDHNTFPYIDYDTHDRMDVSKLDQWEILFEHATERGLFLHFKTQEAENQGLLDGGGLGALRRLYYRELIARFGHHPALNWNMGEEIGEWQPKQRTPPQYTHQRLAMAEYFNAHDPYQHHIVIHNGNWFDDVYGPNSHYTGASLQTNQPDFRNVHGSVLNVLESSKKAGKIWAVAVDEPGDAQFSLVPDSVDPDHDNARMNALWGGFLAGAWGVEWYFGYKHPHSDLTCEDWRVRDKFWDQCKIALDFLNQQDLPYTTMESHDDLIVDNGPTRQSAKGDYCMALPGEAYLVLVKKGDAISLTLEAGDYKLHWYNPRKGGELQKGEIATISAASKSNHSLGMPPEADGKDWIAILRKP